MQKTFRFWNLFLIILFTLAACNLPSGTPSVGQAGANLTAAAETVSAQLTQLPALTSTNTLAVQPTGTLALPTGTAAATATSNCNNSDFIDDITIPDGTVMDPNENFTKTWRLKNIGTCTWTTSYAVVFSSGNQMDGPAVQALTGNVNPGQTVDISVNLTAPASNGTYTGNFKLRDGAGVMFASFYVQIKVQGGGGGGGSPSFAVTSVTYTVGTWSSPGFVDCPKITANITTNGVGTVTYYWTRSDSGQPNNTSGPQESLTFGSAGTQAVSAQWSLGSFWAGGDDEWMGIYIDDPNHQGFGHANMPPCTSP